jgi:iron complex outermembrane receptor protein
MDAGKLKVVWDLTDSVRLVSLTSYNKLTRDAVFDWSGAPYEILVQKAHGEIESSAEELHFEGKTDKGAWLVGGYIAHDEILDSNRTLLGQNANVGLVRFYGSTLLATPFNSGGYTALQMSQAFRTYEDIGNIETDTWSLFANVDHQLTNDLKLTLGVRYSQDKQDYAGCSRDFNGNMLPNVNVVNRALFFAAYGLVAPISQGQCNTFDPVKKSFGLVSLEARRGQPGLARGPGLDGVGRRPAVRLDLTRGQGRRDADQRRQHLDPERPGHPGTADRL